MLELFASERVSFFSGDIRGTGKLKAEVETGSVGDWSLLAWSPPMASITCAH